MYYNQSCAAKGEQYGGKFRNFQLRSMQRAAVSIYKTEKSYEMLVFAPGRIKENFQLNVKGDELTVSYAPPEGFPQVDWMLREYSRGGFERTFTLAEDADSQNIAAKYVDGVLQVSVPIVPGKEVPKQDIKIS